MPQGTFIVIEGTDGSGKKTQFSLIIERLQSEGYDIANFDFPQYEKPSSYFVREYLNGRYGEVDSVGPYTSSLFFALDRYESAPNIQAALDEGKVVIANRYTGSNMAHQGTKFDNAEERKGYYLWLDAIEFQMLKIPRPDLSLVLRVPANIAQTLVDQKELRTYTNKKRDIHEADLNHLEKSVEVYDNLCELFPKDFKQLDCVRDNKLLDVETIHNLIWETIKPMLPPKKRKTSLKKKNAVSNNLIKDVSNHDITLQDVSFLISKQIESFRSTSYLEITKNNQAFHEKNQKGQYSYFVPSSFDEKTNKSYIEIMDVIFDTYSNILTKLTEYIEMSSSTPAGEQDDTRHSAALTEAISSAQYVLPLASKTMVNVTGQVNAVQELVMHLNSDTLDEAKEVNYKLLESIKEDNSKIIGNNDTDSKKVTQAIKRLTLKNLPENHSSESEPVTLSSVWPRNELDIVPDILYKYSGLSIKQIKSEVDKWHYDKKLQVFEKYISNNSDQEKYLPGKSLEKVHYSWDLICDYTVFRSLQARRSIEDLESQILTPRYGYEIPQLIEEAGLTDDFESCFDLSLKLYSILQSAGFECDAQYVTLLGHRMRSKVTFNAREAFQILEVTSKSESPSYRKITLLMQEKLSEVHPLLSEAILRQLG